MSHIECGPLAQYNSLTDHHLSGYFNNTRIKKHLTKSGLVSKSGDVIPETVYRMTNARREHRKNIRNLLAQAIVHKTLDLERTRQVTIRKKLEEISKIELVRRVRADRHRKGDEELLTFFTPRMQKREKQKPRKIASDDGSVQEADDLSNEEDKDDLCPDSSHRQRLAKHFPKAEIDTRNLATLDSVALREYAKVLEQLDRQNTGRKSTLTSLNSFRRSSEDNSSRVAKNAPPSTKKSRPQSSKYAAGDEASFTKDKKKGRMVLHRTEPALLHQTRLQSLVEISMRFMGSTSKVALACLDGDDKSQEVMIEQQHCGGNTLIVFRERLLANSKFSFVSRRHKGYPFSLSLYIDGVKDSRLSSCCEYRHRPGAKLGGHLGHFVFLSAKGAAPCYRCQVEKEEKKKKKKKKEKIEPEYEEDFDGDASDADTAVKDVQEEEEEETEKTDPEKVEPEEESFIPVFETPRRKTSSASSSCDSSKSFASLEQVDAAESAEETKEDEKNEEDDEEDDERETAVLGYGTEEEEEEEESIAKNVTVIADVHQQDKDDCNEVESFSNLDKGLKRKVGSMSEDKEKAFESINIEKKSSVSMNEDAKSVGSINENAESDRSENRDSQIAVSINGSKESIRLKNEDDENVVSRIPDRNAVASTNENKNSVGSIKKARKKVRSINEDRESIGSMNEGGKNIGSLDEDRKLLGSISKSKRSVGSINKDRESFESMNGDQKSVGSINEDKESVRSINEDKESVGSINEDQESVGSINKIKKSVGSINEDKESVGSINKSKKCVGSVNEDKESVGSINEDKESVGSINEDKESVGSINKIKKSVGSINEDQESVGSINEDKESVGSINKSKKSVGSINEDNERVGSINEDNESVRSINEDKESVGSINEDKESVGFINKSKKSVESINEDQKSVGSINKSKKCVGSVNENKESVGSINEEKESVGSIIEDQESVGSLKKSGERIGSINKDQKNVGSSNEDSFFIKEDNKNYWNNLDDGTVKDVLIELKYPREVEIEKTLPFISTDSGSLVKLYAQKLEADEQSFSEDEVCLSPKNQIKINKMNSQVKTGNKMHSDQCRSYLLLIMICTILSKKLQ